MAALIMWLHLVLFVNLHLLHSIPPVHSAKIVGFPSFAGSQYIIMQRIAEELVSRGHHVTLLVSSAQKINPIQGVSHAIYKVPYPQGFIEEKVVASIIKKWFLKEVLFNPYSIATLQYSLCEAVLNDTKLLDSLKNYDLIITDSYMYCGPIIKDYLGIMRVEICPASPRYPGLLSPYHALFTLSYIPQMHANNPENMTFMQRVKNTLVFVVWKIMVRNVFRRLQDLKTRFNVKPERSFLEAKEDKELTLFLADFAVEFPYPIQPDQKLIGPLNIRPVKPLPPDLQQLIDSSGDDGFIIVSFGSNVASVLDKEKVDIMAEAFGRLKQKVFWRLKGYIPSSLSANIKSIDWLPQNDLLAHPKIRLFVSHVGQNSLYEAAYRGVPVVALPLYADQPENAELMIERGLGLSLDYQTLTANDMYNTIQRVIQEPSFKENAQRISGLLSDRSRSPAQEAADWIEYTLRHGGLAHLRPYSSQLAWYQYFLVDVVLFLVLIVFAVIFLVKYTVRFVCWLCCRATDIKVKTQ